MTKNSCVNLALFATQQKLLFADFFKLYQTVAQPCRIFVIAADVNAVARVEKLAKRINKTGFVEGKSFVEMALLRVPISFRDVAGRIERWVAPTRKQGPALLVVDMSWGLETNSATANFEGWPALAETLTQQSEIVSPSVV
ncbi:MULTISPECIES: hypothetical protein [unclassified Bradyrhizobium]|uniref:hypothetical protein n=1 Tax=unclassified Bradyrhizobium TaxID=2631580 RepID=UPI0029165A78|nr:MULTISPECIES: hypothetical protein [unclassified Bradyrhizobium]